MPYNFAATAQAVDVAHLDIPFDLIQDTQLFAADGAITLKSGVVRVTKTSAAALTIAVPDQDGQMLTIISETAFAHTITTVAPGFNKSASFLTVTMSTTVGDRVLLISADGVWWIVQPSQHGNVYQSVQVISADGAVNIKNGLVIITKATALAGTLANPTAGVDDGAYLEIVSTTAAAHVITDATSGFNNKGASGTATFGIAIGNAFSIAAYNGRWYTTSLLGVTIA